MRLSLSGRNKGELVNFQSQIPTLVEAEQELLKPNLSLVDKLAVIYFMTCYRSGMQAFVQPEILNNILYVVAIRDGFFRSAENIERVTNYLSIIKEYHLAFAYPDNAIQDLILQTLEEALQDLKPIAIDNTVL